MNEISPQSPPLAPLQGTSTLIRWLVAERDGVTAVAESALAELLSGLPDARPSPGFAERVLAAAPYLPQPWAWPLRAAVAVCLLATGVGLIFILPLVALISERLSLADVIATTAHALAAVVDHLAILFVLGKVLAALCDALLLLVTSPPVVTAAIVVLAFSALTLRWLAQLLSPQRRSEYVPTS